VTLALLAAACGSESAAPEEEPAAAAPSTSAPQPAPTAPIPAPASRTEGPVAVRATTAPEWQANGSADVMADAEGVLRFAQVLVAERAFELHHIELESQGLIGADGTATFDVAVTVRLLPDGVLPARFDGGPLPVVTTADGTLALRALDTFGPGTFDRLTLDEQVELPEGRLLIGLELRPQAPGAARGIRLTGRRGAIGGTAECADHNPDGMFLLVEPAGADGSQIMRSAGSEANTEDCRGTSGPAAFNITLRLEGAPLAAVAARELASGLPAVPAVAALEPPRPAPAPRPNAPAPGAPAAEPERSRVRLATFPLSQRRVGLGITGYWWGPSAFAEVAQSVRVTSAFDLTELRFGVQRASAVANWTTVPEETIAWDHDVLGSGTVRGVRFRVTIWPLPDGGAEVIDMAGVAPLTEQMTTADVPIAGYTGLTSDASARLRLATPVRLEPGYYLVSIGIDGMEDPNVFNFYVIGRSSGHTMLLGFERDKGVSQCEYPPLPSSNDYPHGRAYYRVFAVTGRPTLLANATTVFREHRAKVLHFDLNECRQRGNFDVMLPGDLELTLLGD
jgi:hypothetical protein